MSLLGIDEGTSAVKAVLYDPSSTRCAKRGGRNASTTPALGGWSRMARK